MIFFIITTLTMPACKRDLTNNFCATIDPVSKVPITWSVVWMGNVTFLGGFFHIKFSQQCRKKMESWERWKNGIMGSCTHPCKAGKAAELAKLVHRLRRPHRLKTQILSKRVAFSPSLSGSWLIENIENATGGNRKNGWAFQLGWMSRLERNKTS